MIKADAYITFEQTNANGLPINDQLWYRVTEFTLDSVTHTWNESDGLWSDGTTAQTAFIELLNQAQDVWINARIGEFNYIQGADATMIQCGDDINISDITGTSEPITFTYDREATARYAIEHSYNNNSTLRSANRVTEYINATLPFAEFIHSDLNPSGSQEATGSAMFTSETIWMGGMPMTDGQDMNCGLNWENNPTNYGWRYCADVNTASKAWTLHKGVILHYTNADTDDFSPDGGTSNILTSSGTIIGTQLNPIGLENTDRISITDLEPFIAPISYGGTLSSGIFNPDGLGEFSQIHLSSIVAGDYVLINPESTDHGMVVVGWQDAKDCGEVITTNTNPAFSATNLYPDYQTANANVNNPVPYISDYTTAQSPMPRPFYCTNFVQAVESGFTPPPGQGTVLRFDPHDYFFFHMPNQVRLTVQYIHVNNEWDWGVQQ